MRHRIEVGTRRSARSATGAPWPLGRRGRTPSRARALRSVIAVAVVFGLTGTHALPAVAQSYSEDAGAPSGWRYQVDVQRLRVPSDVQAPAVTADGGLGALAAGGWTVPVRGDLRDPFGPRLRQPVAGVASFHRGQDIGAPCGTPIRAAAGGRVVEAGWYGSYGNWVLIEHGDGTRTGYAHDSRVLVQPGQTVRAGETIATVGSTGASSGCHVHFEMRVGDTAIDPAAFMRAQGQPLR